MAKYNEYGVDKFGNVDPTRQMVHDMVGLFPSHGGTGTREMADDLYSWMKKNKGGGEDDDGKDDGKGDGKGGRGGWPPIKDINFGMDGKPTYTNPIKKFNKQKAIEDQIGDPRDPERRRIGNSKISRALAAPTMKDGGVVRGAGKALRGRGRGKMV